MRSAVGPSTLQNAVGQSGPSTITESLLTRTETGFP